MAKREKIILVLMIIAVAYAGYIYLFDSSTQQKLPSLDKQALQGEIDNVKTMLVAQKLNDVQDYKVTQALAEWTDSPFYDRSRFESEGSGKRQFEPDPEVIKLFTYTGFVEVGYTKLAIVNGLEYKVEEELDIPNYFVAGIFRDKTVIEERNATNDVLNRVSIPLKENFVNLFGESNEEKSAPEQQ